MGKGTDTYNKVEHLLEKYNLGESFGKELELYWTGQERERKSLRTLARLFNERLLRNAIRQVGATSTKGEVSTYYRTLTDEKTSSGERTDVRNKLQRMGLNVDTVQSDFVTYQAIRSYLKEVRGAKYRPNQKDDSDRKAVESVQKLQSKLEAVADSNLQRLIDRESVSIGNYQISTNLSVYCEDCGLQYTFDQLSKEGGCACKGHSND